MTFQGFADDKASFFQRLEKHQDRDWFAKHKAEFQEGYAKPMQALLDEVASKVDAAFDHTELGAPKVFRIFRDTRFSKDKSPYKTHVGGFLPTKAQGKATEVPMALYLHVGLPSSFAAAGHYMMDPAALARYREAVADERGAELDKILKSLTKKGFTVDSYESYKKVPKGYDADHPRAEHLKRKGLTVGFPALPSGIIAKPALTGWLVKHVKTAAPLVEWLVFATA